VPLKKILELMFIDFYSVLAREWRWKTRS